MTTDTAATVRKKFRAKMAETRERSDLRASAWEGDDAATRRRRRAESIVLQERFNHHYLGHYFKGPGAAFHDELYEALENHSRIAVRAPRGHAKTTVVTFSVTLKQAVCGRVLRAWERGTLQKDDPELYADILDVMGEEIDRRWVCAHADILVAVDREERAAITERIARLDAQRKTGLLPLFWDPYIQVISATMDQAEEFTGAILDELVENERLHADWGALMKKKRPAAGDWIATTGVRVRAFGMLSGIRGGKHGPERPRLAIFDDPDSELTIGNVDLRDRMTRKITAATDFGLEPGKSRLFMAGTPLHADCQVCRFTAPDRFQSWHKLRYAAIKADGVPLWPERFTLEELTARRQDDPEAFDMEMMDLPPAEDLTFCPPTYYEEADLVEGMRTVFAFDPALARTNKSDFQATISISLHPDGWIAIRRVELMRIGDPMALMQEVNGQVKEAGADLNVIETIGFQQLLVTLSEIDQAETMTFISWLGIPHQPEGKDMRIRGIAPAWNAGRIRLPKNGSCYRLERQARDWPNGKRDGLDILELAIRELRKSTSAGGRGEVRHRPRRSGFRAGSGGW